MAKYNNKSIMKTVFLGPYFTQEYYNNNICIIRKRVKVLVNDLLEISKAPFYALINKVRIQDELLQLHWSLADYKSELKNLLLIENLNKIKIENKKLALEHRDYKLKIKIELEKKKLEDKIFYEKTFHIKNVVKPLPDISTLATNNDFNILPRFKDSFVSYKEQMKYTTKCVHCSSILVLCECNGYPLQERKYFKFNKYEDYDDIYPSNTSIFWGDKIYYKHNNIKVATDEVVNKYKLLIDSFRNIRSSKNLKYLSFIVYEQIFYELYTTNNAYRMVDLLLKYTEIDNMLDSKEDIELENLKNNEDDYPYERMPEDPQETMFNENDIVLVKFKSIVESQMEEAHGEDNINIQQTGNVILTTHAEESVAEPVQIDVDNWQGLCSSQNITKYTQLMERWQRFTDFTWSVNDSSPTRPLREYVLPRDLILKDVNSPNNIMFKLYTFFRSDMEIKFVINSNKFHCGQLQASFYYGDTMDKNSKDRKNIYCASQMTHCLLDAASANDGILKIPYRHYKPLMATTIRGDDMQVLDMGSLRIFVLNQLRLPAGDTSTVTISMFYRYISPTFHGMKPQNIGKIEAQMMNVSNIKQLVNGTANLVNQVFPDEQRDNPTDIIPPKAIVPWSAHSWCIGDMIPEATNSLRLQATGNTPHPPGTLPNEPEMQIDYINRIYGLVKQINWNISNEVGDILCKMPFSPNWSISEYPELYVSNTEEYRCNILPPIAVLANMFAYWRGSIEYKLDFISTQFHTGRLILAYLPREVLTRDPTIEDLSYCDHLVFDLREDKQLTYVNSFLSDKPWWPRRSAAYTSTEQYPPGYIYIGVLNRLTAPQNISPEITFNIYMRAGTDFEVHIPVSPTIGLSFNTNVVKKRDTLRTYMDNYGPPYTSMYVGTWRTTGTGLVFRYGPVTDHITQFQIMKTYKTVFELVSPEVKIDHTEFKDMKYLVLFPSEDGVYAYGAPFTTRMKADQFANSIGFDGSKWIIPYDKMMRSNKADGQYLPQTKKYWWKPLPLSETNIIPNMGEERDMDGNLKLNIQRNIRSTNNGFITFGEKITNIKQLLRRYAPYADFKVETKARGDRTTADFAFPVMPQGLDFNVTNASGVELKYANMVRDGPLAILASGYRFFRGSIRFRFMINSLVEGSFWVQHRPEEALHNTKIYIPNSHFRENVFQPGYASIIQMTKVNEILEIEIPFYLPGQFGMLQRPDLSKVEDAVHYSMGTLYCGFDSVLGGKSDSGYSVQVFYSMGDDMAFTIFQGFPPVFDLSMFNQGAIAQSDDKPSVHFDVSEKDLKEAGTSTNPPKPEEENKIKKPNWFQRKITVIEGKMKKGVEDFAFNVAGKAVDIATDSLGMKQPLSEDKKEVVLEDEQNNLINSIKAMTTDMSGDKQQALLSIVTHLIHTMINPTLSQLAWSVASIFMHMGLLCWTYMEKYMRIFKKFVESFNKLCRRTTKSEKVTQAESDENEDIEAAFVSTCVTGMLAMIGQKDKPLPKTLPNFATYLYDGLPKFSYTANGLYRFLKNNLYMFKKIFLWLISKFNKNYIYYTELAGSKKEVKEFVLNVQWCLDPFNKQKVHHDPASILKVYELANIAQCYLAKKAVSNVTQRLYLFEKYCTDIIKLKGELVRMRISPEIRFEPWVYAVVGDSNVGKSHLSNTICNELMHSINYKSYSGIIHTVAPGNDFWNNLEDQPCCNFDDFLCIADPMYSLKQIGELFALKSKAIFNPPMAAVEDKNVRYNPLVVSLCMNAAFPHQSGLMINSGFAWRRRRDTMVHATVLPEFKGRHPRSLTKEQKLAYAHLEFQFYKNPSGGEDGRDTGLLPEKYTYAQMLPILIERFHTFFEEECIQYDNAIQEARRFYPDVELSTEDYVKSWKEKISSINRQRVSDEDWEIIQKHITMLHSEKNNARINEIVNKHLLEKKVAELDENGKPKLPPLAKDGISPGPTYEGTGVEGIKLGGEPKKKDEVVIINESKKLINNDNPVKPNSADSHIISTPDTVLPPGFNTKIYSQQIYLTNKLKFLEDLRSKVPCKMYCYCIDKFVFAYNFTGPDTSQPLKEGQTEHYGKMMYSYPLKLGFEGHQESELKACGNSNCIFLNPAVLFFTYKNCPETRVIPDDHKPLIIQDFIEKERAKGTGMSTIIMADADEVLRELDNKHWWQKLWNNIPKCGTIFLAMTKLIGVLALIGTFIHIAAFFFTAPKDAAVAVKTTEFNNNEIDFKLFKQQSEIMAWTPIEPKKMEEQAIKYTDGSRVKLNPAVKPVGSQSYESEVTINAKITRNTFWLLCEYGPPECRRNFTFRCLGLNKNNFIFLDHYLFAMLAEVNPVLYYVKQGQYVNLDMSVVTNNRKLNNSAIYIGELPPNIPYFCNIIKFIIKSKNTQNVPPMADLYEYMVDNEGLSYKMNIYNFNRLDRKTRVDVQNDDMSGTIVNNVYVYPKGARGMCGSVLVSKSNIVQPIIGIHVAGLKDNSEGYAEAIVYETFQHLLDDKPHVDEEKPVNNMGPVDDAMRILSGNVELLGTLPKNKAVYPPNDTRLVHSDCVGLYVQPTYDKPVLHANDPRIIEAPFSPLYEGCKYHANIVKLFNNKHLEFAYEDLKQNLLCYAKPRRMQIGKLDYNQAICGLEENIDYPSLPMDTSEGYPWTERRPNGCSNKSWLFTFEMNKGNKLLLNMDKELYDTMEKRDIERSQGKIQPILFVDCLKDAKLPKEKVLIPGKTRVFSISPVDFTIQVRQYFMDFVAAYRCGRFNTEVAIGMDFTGLEADKLANYLLENGNNMITADYSKFGDTLAAQCILLVFRLINDWYKFNNEKNHEYNAHIRNVICYELMNAQHLMLNLIYKCFGGMPSGNPITVEINSLVNSLYIRLMWIEIMLQQLPSYADLTYFNNHVKIVTYGDDLILSVTDDVKYYFNLNTLKQKFLEYDIVFTNSAKNEINIPFNSILAKDTTFLKCNFAKHETRNVWVMQMDKRVVEETCNWRDKKHADSRAATMEVCHAAMELMYTHGSKYYNSNRTKMIEYWLDRGVIIKIPEWQFVDIRVYDK